MKNQKTIVISSVVLMLIGISIAAYLFKKTEQDQISKLNSTQASVFVRPHSPVIGPNDAKVVLVEFFDPECESCRMFAPAVKNLLKEFPGKIKLVMRYVAFHKNSRIVIAILESSRKQGKFWETLDILFKSQPVWGNHHNPSPEKIWDYLPGVKGLNIAQLVKDMKDPAIAEVINLDNADAQILKVRQTPTFFVNGKRLTTFGYEPLRALINSELNN